MENGWTWCKFIQHNVFNHPKDLHWKQSTKDAAETAVGCMFCAIQENIVRWDGVSSSLSNYPCLLICFWSLYRWPFSCPCTVIMIHEHVLCFQTIQFTKYLWLVHHSEYKAESTFIILLKSCLNWVKMLQLLIFRYIWQLNFQDTVSQYELQCSLSVDDCENISLWNCKIHLKRLTDSHRVQAVASAEMR